MWKPRVVVTALVLVTLGSLLFLRLRGAGFRDTERDIFSEPEVLTQSRLRRLSAAIDEYGATEGRLPERLEDVVPTAITDTAASLGVDGWGRRIQYAVTTEGYELRSRGPDGELDTGDDIIARGPGGA